MKNRYCSSCGAAVKTGLSFCNHCGEEVNTKERVRERKEVKTTDLSAESLVWAIVGVSVGGLAILVGLAAVLKEVFPNEIGQILAFISIGFLMLMVAESVFIWLLVRSRREEKKTDEIAPQTGYSTKEIIEAQARALPEPAASITEHTTRTLEKAERESAS